MKISKKGLEQLKRKRDKAKEDMKKAWKRIGETAGRECDWHDNAAFDQAKADHDFHQRRYSELNRQVQEAEVVESHGDRISLGDTLLLELDGERGEYILGEEREQFTTISGGSKVGQALLGKKVGASFKVEVGDDEIEVTIHKTNYH